ncbi:hypothetical protein HDU97_004043 [Phlyctochytrium planicorne]|nr:hypothetical protein HDU97_004043 [Phlyctochytrium planicorne]
MDAHLQNCINFLTDVRDFMKERSDLEKEFARKLESLARRHAHRRERRSGAPPLPPASSSPSRSTLHLGDGPWSKEREEDGGDLELADADLMDGFHIAFSQKLISERDKFYAEKDKSKKDYDDACDSVESLKAKHDRTTDQRVKEKLKKAWEDEIMDLNSAKNLYVLAIDMSNSVKNKYYQTDLPQLLSDMQQLAESTISGLKGIWTNYAEEESRFLESCQKHATAVITSISQIDPVCDADPRGPQFWFTLRQQHQNRANDSNPDTLSVKITAEMLHAAAPPLPLTQQPPDFVFVPSIMWRERAQMSKDERSRTSMINRLRVLRRNLAQLDKEVETRKRGIEGMKVLMEAYVRNPAQGDAFDVKENILEVSREITLLLNTRAKLQTTVECIVSNFGDEAPTDKFHSFKTAAFAIPTTCDQCRQTIWGVAKTGLCAHIKCELKIPPTCTGIRISRSKHRSKQLPAHRSTTPTISRPVHLETPQIEAVVGSIAVVLYDYEPPCDAPEDEISVVEGDSVTVVETDDGSGWTRVLCGDKCGLVPTAYIQIKHKTLPIPSVIQTGGTVGSSWNPPHHHHTVNTITHVLPAVVTPVDQTNVLPVAKEIISPKTEVLMVSPLSVSTNSATTVNTVSNATSLEKKASTEEISTDPRDSNATLSEKETGSDASKAFKSAESVPVAGLRSHNGELDEFHECPLAVEDEDVQLAVPKREILEPSPAALLAQSIALAESHPPEIIKRSLDIQAEASAPPNLVENTNRFTDGAICVKARALFDYKEHGEDEISMKVGQDLFILEDDDGSGWVTVHDGMREGLVPASYLEKR